MNQQDPGRRRRRRSLVVGNARGLSLVEAIAATLIAVLAVVGLAYSFGVGRGMIDRYRVERCAMGRAELLVDSLVTVKPAALLVSGSQPFWIDGAPPGTSSWTVAWVDDPIDGLAGSSPSDPNPNDMKRITVQVVWGAGGSTHTLSISRMVLGT